MIVCLLLFGTQGHWALRSFSMSHPWGPMPLTSVAKCLVLELSLPVLMTYVYHDQRLNPDNLHAKQLMNCSTIWATAMVDKTTQNLVRVLYNFVHSSPNFRPMYRIFNNLNFLNSSLCLMVICGTKLHRTIKHASVLFTIQVLLPFTINIQFAHIIRKSN